MIEKSVTTRALPASLYPNATPVSGLRLCLWPLLPPGSSPRSAPRRCWPEGNGKRVSWRRATKGRLTCLFSARRVRVADGHKHRMLDSRVSACLATRSGSSATAVDRGALWKVIILGASVAVVAAMASARVTVLVFGGATVPVVTAIDAVPIGSGHSIWSAVMIGGLPIEVADKLVVALVAWALVRRRLRGRA